MERELPEQCDSSSYPAEAWEKDLYLAKSQPIHLPLGSGGEVPVAVLLDFGQGRIDSHSRL